MNESSSWSSVIEDLTCPICLEVFHRPRQLPCSHTFCLLCLQKYANVSNRKDKNWKNRLFCPSCRTQTEIPQNGTSGFARNVSLEKSIKCHIEEKRGVKFLSKIPPECQLCHEVKGSTAICGHCGLWVCEPCGKGHSDRVSQDSIQLKLRLKELQDSVKESQKEEEEQIGRLEERVKRAVEERVSDLQDKRDELCRKIQQVKENERERSLCISEEIRRILSSYEESQNNKDWKAMSQLYEKMKTFSSTISTGNKKPAKLSVNLKKLTLNCDEAERASKVSRANNLVANGDWRMRYRVKRSYSKNKWDRKICGRPAGIAISPWTKNFYITSSDACKVYIYDRWGKSVAKIGSRGHNEGSFLCPVGIAFGKQSHELFVADKWKHCIYVFDEEGNYLRQIGKKGKGLGEFCSPEGIATDDNDNIYVADTCNDRIQVVDREGGFLREIGSVKKETIGQVFQYTRREFKEPTGVAVTDDGSMVYVADSANHKVKVFDVRTGIRLLSVGSKGNDQSQFERPECVAVDAKGFILVGDSGNGRIQVFNQEGIFVRYLGFKSPAERGEFGWLSAIAVSEEGTIAVADFKNNAIAFY